MPLLSGEVNTYKKALIETFSDRHDPEKQKSIIKQVIGSLTQGVDLSNLFPEMIMVIFQNSFIKNLTF